VSKRLAVLEGMIAKGSKDPFAWYALAMEYVGANRIEDALSTFTKLRDVDATYVPMYLMCGQMLTKAGRASEARAWLEEGVTRARAKGDSHALSEIETALAELD
jgi:predicted Zn-dependent protease